MLAPNCYLGLFHVAVVVINWKGWKCMLQLREVNHCARSNSYIHMIYIMFIKEYRFVPSISIVSHFHFHCLWPRLFNWGKWSGTICSEQNNWCECGGSGSTKPPNEVNVMNGFHHMVMFSKVQTIKAQFSCFILVLHFYTLKNFAEHVLCLVELWRKLLSGNFVNCL